MDDSKKKITLIVTSVLLMVVVVIRVSYAYFSSQATSTTKTVTTGNLSITYTDGQVVNASGITPIYDEDMEDSASKITFNVKNTGTMKSYVDISLTDIVMDTKLANLEFKWALYETNSSYSSIGTEVNNGNFRNVANSKQLLAKNIEIASSGTKYYSLYIWLRETDLDQGDLMAKSFSGKILVEGMSQKDSELLSTVIKNDNSDILNSISPDFSEYLITGDRETNIGVDEDGETYYFRGHVSSNYVKIDGLKWQNDRETYVIYGNDVYLAFSDELGAIDECDRYYMDYGANDAEECKSWIEKRGHSAGEDMLWRIVRINGDGTIRLIADGSIGESKFNENTGNEKYVGYTYDNSEPNIQDGTNSTIKAYLENWYNSNMSAYDKFIANTRYCNDTTNTSADIDGYYGVYDRWNESGSYTSDPTFKCGNTSKTYGGEYDLKVGLITSDEAHYAGSLYISSSASYLWGETLDAFTMTPFSSNKTDIVIGYYTSMYDPNMGVSADVRPVINLRADTLYTEGNGQIGTPYIIK